MLPFSQLSVRLAPTGISLSNLEVSERTGPDRTSVAACPVRHVPAIGCPRTEEEWRFQCTPACGRAWPVSQCSPPIPAISPMALGCPETAWQLYGMTGRLLWSTYTRISLRRVSPCSGFDNSSPPCSAVHLAYGPSMPPLAEPYAQAPRVCTVSLCARSDPDAQAPSSHLICIMLQ